jgi:hypothetical protein
MFKRILQFLSFLLVLTISGMPLAFVQVGAWLSMIDEFYQETQSIRLSVEWTFDGDRPCGVCQFVNEQINLGKKGLSDMDIFSNELKLVSEQTEIITDHGLKMVGALCLPIWHISSAYDPAELPPPRIRI